MDLPDRKAQLLHAWRVLQRRRWVVVLSVATVTLVALVGSFLATPLYRATVTLQIERQNPDILTFRDLGQTDYSWAAYSDFYQTQYKILSSDAVARRAVQRLHLTGHPAFREAVGRPGLMDRLKSWIPSRATSRPPSPEEQAARWVRGNLEITPVRNSHLVQISWVSTDPDLAAQVANAVADAYIQFNLESKFSTTDQASEFLANQIGTLKEEIAAIESRLQDYGEAKRIVSIDDTNNVTLKALADVAQRRTEARTRLAEKEAQYNAIRNASPEALPEVLHSDLIQRLKSEYAAYEAEYSEKAEMFKEDWPRLQALRSKMDQAEARLRAETDEIYRQVLAAAETDYRRASQEYLKLDELFRQQEAEAQRLKRDAYTYATLQAEVARKRDTLNALLRRQNEMSLSTRLKELDATSSNIRIVDRARPPAGPFHPNKKLNGILGLLLGASLGVGLAFLLESLDNTVQSAAQVEAATGLPTLAAVPRPAGPRSGTGGDRADSVELVVHRAPRTAVAEAYRELRTAILLSHAGRPPRILMVTSALPEEGKSSTVANLAAALARLDRRVLLVDTDLRRPRLHRIFGLDAGEGVSSLLSGLTDDPAALIQETCVPGVHLLPSGPIPPNPSELLNSEAFAALGPRLLALGYDHLLFDSPPVLSVPDPRLVAHAAELVLLVVRHGRTPRDSLRLVASKLTQAGIKVSGAVLNDVPPQAPGYPGYGPYYGAAGDGAAPESESAASGGRPAPSRVGRPS